jgi:hypothetical protein
MPGSYAGALPVARLGAGLIMSGKRLEAVANAIAWYDVRGRLKVEDVVLAYCRAEYTTGNGLDAVLEEIDGTLKERGIPDTARRSVLNIVFELAFNSVIHSSHSARPGELLVIAISGGHVSVSIFGDTRPAQVDRLERVLALVRNLAAPPDHQVKLLERRNRDAWRRRKDPKGISQGGSLGVLTIAALSSEKLYFMRKPSDRSERFLLQSVV